MSDNGMLFNMQTGESFFVNETAMVILRSLREKNSLDQIVLRLAEEFNTMGAGLHDEVLAFLNDMVLLQLIDKVQDQVSIQHS